MNTEEGDVRLRRLRFRASRRGFREMDLLMGAYALHALDAQDPQALDAFEWLLEQPDQQVFAWVLGREAPPQGPADAVLENLRAFRLSDRLLDRSDEPG